MNNKQKSPLTDLDSEVNSDFYTRLITYNDPVCGLFVLSNTAKSQLYDNENLGRKIAKVLATRKLRNGNSRVFIDESNVDFKILDNGFTQRTIDSLLSEYPKDPIFIIDEALINLSNLVKEISDDVEIDKINRWYLYAHDQYSQKYILTQLLNLEYIAMVKDGDHPGGSPNDLFEIPSITIETNGWKRLQEINTNSKDSNKVFVAMSFDRGMDSFYENGIHQALEFLGYQPPFRVDKIEHNEKICDLIIAKIKESRFVVADVTCDSSGAYFEAGYALGLGLPVIWTVSKEFFTNNKDKIHFDTRQYNHIIYENADELKKRLVDRIKATIHRPPYKERDLF